jgi:hypothetical protein
MIILPANTLSTGGYEVANSCRFDKASAAYMHKSQGTPSSRRTFTYSGWIKLGLQNIYQIIFESANGSHNFQIVIQDDGNNNDLRIYDYDGSTNLDLRTSQAFRDHISWYHICVAIDTTQSTASDRAKLYVNGTRVTAFDTETYPSQNYDTAFVSGKNIQVGRQQSGSDYFDGYMAEVVFIDGSALAPTSFGEFDEDSPQIWKPIDVSGLSFGTNGFYLDFEDSSNLGNDKNGGTDLTEVNLSATDSVTDSPTNNFTVLNPLVVPLSYIPTYAEGNTKITAQSNSGRFQSVSTIGASSGKWYAEFRIDSSQYHTLGVCAEAGFTNASTLVTSSNNYLGQSGTLSYIYYNNDGDVWANGTINSGYGDTITSAGDILGVALDLDNHKLYFSKNGTWQNSGVPTSGSTGTGAISIATGHTYFFAVGDLATGSFSGTSCNFGNPAFAISSGNADGNGYGNMEFAVPENYYVLCSKNLAEFGG